MRVFIKWCEDRNSVVAGRQHYSCVAFLQSNLSEPKRHPKLVQNEPVIYCNLAA